MSFGRSLVLGDRGAAPFDFAMGRGGWTVAVAAPPAHRYGTAAVTVSAYASVRITVTP